jgi:hypothetical protein
MWTANLYPNPVTNNGMVEINTAVATNFGFAVTDISGKMIAHWEQVVQAGSCHLSLLLPVSCRGIYFLSVANEKSKTTVRFIKR